MQAMQSKTLIGTLFFVFASYCESLAKPLDVAALRNAQRLPAGHSWFAHCGARVASEVQAGGLPGEAEGELQNAGIVCIGNPHKVAVGEFVRRVLEVCVVQCVERFNA